MAVASGAAGRRLSVLRLSGLVTGSWKSPNLSRGPPAVSRVVQMDHSIRGYISSSLNSKREPVRTQ